MRAILFAALLASLGTTLGCEKKRESKDNQIERTGDKAKDEAHKLKEKVDD